MMFFKIQKKIQKRILEEKKENPSKIILPEVVTYHLGRHCFSHGEVLSKGSVMIEGDFSGKIVAAQWVKVAKNARFLGSIKAESVFIDGVFKGTIAAKQIVYVGAQAVLLGEIRAQRMIVEEGGLVSGKCWIMGESYKSFFEPSQAV